MAREVCLFVHERSAPASLTVQRSLVDERVAADRAMLTTLVLAEEDLYVDGRQLTDPGRRNRVDDFTVRAGGDLARRADHLGTGHAL